METCILTIIKNEQEYLGEFIKYHLGLGIDHIFVFEDIGSESHEEITSRYTDSVTLKSVFELNDSNTHKLYNLCPSNKNYRGHDQLNFFKEGMLWIKENFSYGWCFAIDCDEYITLENETDTLDSVLEKYSDYEAIALQWENHNANGHVSKPDYSEKGVVETYTQKCGGSINDDWIRSRKYAFYLPTYQKYYYQGHHICSGLAKWCKTDYTQDLKTESFKNIYLRHYITKSWEEWIWKLNTRGMFHPVHRNYEEFFCMNEDLRDRQDELMKMTENIKPDNAKRVLITGVCGFIGYHVAKKLSRDYNVVGIDNVDDYYDVNLKKWRLSQLPHVHFVRCNISNLRQLDDMFETYNPSIVINLAAQAGVRHSFENPNLYIKSNLIGFRNVLECCKKYNIKQLIYASSSSVYGNCTETPFSENQQTDNQLSPYAMTKKSNELDACIYSHVCDTQMTGLRLFSVYGEYGRPDMAYFKFADNIIKDEPIELYNNGECLRDFTYVGDVAEAISRIVGNNTGKCEVYNIGNGTPIKTKDFLDLLFESMRKHNLLKGGQELKVQLMERQPGDADITWADTTKFEECFGKLNHTGITDGIDKFVEWYAVYKDLKE